jgi:hypothetical protein
MRVLLFSILLYLGGVVTLLYIRPSYMFKEDGSWKEFNTQSTEDGTPFPIWAFCIVWALTSFAVVKALSIAPSVKLEDIPLPSRVSTEVPTLKPGYYLLNREGSAEAGVPRYVYIGENAPQGRPELN